MECDHYSGSPIISSTNPTYIGHQSGKGYQLLEPNNQYDTSLRLVQTQTIEPKRTNYQKTDSSKGTHTPNLPPEDRRFFKQYINNCHPYMCVCCYLRECLNVYLIAFCYMRLKIFVLFLNIINVCYVTLRENKV